MNKGYQNYIKDLISIIVPVYNTGIYLDNCLNSLINQTYKNIEILLINDGSSDKVTLDIIDKYVNQDKRIRYFNNQNMGISKTRNFGLDNIYGEYLCFVDSDDYIDLDSLEKMCLRMKKDGSNLCQASFLVEYKHFKMRRIKPKDIVYTRMELLKDLCRNMGVNNYLWAKLYKSELFEGVRFNSDLAGFEDVEIMPKIMMGVSHASLMSNRFYHYIQRSGSYTNHMNLDIAMDMFDAFKSQEDYLNSKFIGHIFSNHENYYRSEMMMLYILLTQKYNEESLKDFKLPNYSKENINIIFRLARKIVLGLVKTKYKGLIKE